MIILGKQQEIDFAEEVVDRVIKADQNGGRETSLHFLLDVKRCLFIDSLFILTLLEFENPAVHQISCY